MKLINLVIILILTSNVLAQNKGVVYNKAIHFQLEKEKDTIDFIVADTVLNEKKPVFLFCQGSLPIPLFIRIDKDFVFMFGGGISNFDKATIREHYHLIVISMPKTPFYSEINHLTKSLCYIPDTSKKEEFRTDYLQADFLENYIKRANVVLNFLEKQKWVDNNKLIVAGHSQGAIVATALAYKNKKITHLGVFGYNPNGRIDQMIRQERKNAEKGLQTWEQANENIDYWINFWKNANNPTIMKEHPQLIAWKSFSKPTINEFTSIDIPIYLAYGTEDITSDLCDLIPLKFIEKGKNNLTLKRKIGLSHNFFEVDEKGMPNHKKPHWTEVMNGFIKWTLKQ